MTTEESPAHVETELRDGIAVIALNRPDRRNAIDDGMRGELIEALDWAAQSDDVGAVVLTGRGKAFCAGGDIKAMQARLETPPGRTAINGWNRQQRTHRAVTMLHALPKLTIAAGKGAAARRGCDLALCCDCVVAAEAAVFVMSYVLRGADSRRWRALVPAAPCRTGTSS